MLFDISLTPAQVRALFSWTYSGPAAADVLIAQDRESGAVDAAQGDARTRIPENPAARNPGDNPPAGDYSGDRPRLSAATLATLLREVADAHHAYEEEHGPDPDWVPWYARELTRRGVRV